MAEVLATVAIILILGSLVVMNVVSFQANLRQKALDAKAEIIYTAAQEQMTRIMASGRESVLAPDTGTQSQQAGSASPEASLTSETSGSSRPKPIESAPADSSMSADDAESTLCYITSADKSEGSIASILLGNGTLDDELFSNDWVVEYDCRTLTVHAVFYSENRYNEQSFNLSDSYEEYYSGAYKIALRSFASRLNCKDLIGNNHVGYHGGGTGGSYSSYKLIPSIEINNGEKLTATVKCSKPFITQDLMFTVTLADEFGHKRKAVYTMDSEYSNSKYDVFRYQEGFVGSYAGPHSDDVLKALHGSASFVKTGPLDYVLTLSFDDLSSLKSRFAYLYGCSGNAPAVATTAGNDNLVIGSNIKISVEVSCPTNAEVASGYAGSTFANPCEFNSLFDDETDTSNRADVVAGISCGRHLQNLDSSSLINSAGDTLRVTKAVQHSDVDFSAGGDEESGAAGWEGCYSASSYFNPRPEGSAATAANFKPIDNRLLTSYEAKPFGTDRSYRIIGLTSSGNGGSAGLFERISTSMTLNNIALVDTRIDAGSSGNAGCLAGSVELGENVSLDVDGCQVFLGNPENKNPNEKPGAWVTGKNAGGLFGKTSGTVTIKNSSASSVVEGKGQGAAVGGLVGSADSTLEVELSYADCYLYSKEGQAAGLLCGSASRISSSYSAGFIAAKEGAGLVYGTLGAVSSVYTVCAKLVDDSYQSQHYYATTSQKPSSSSNLYYLRGESTDFFGAAFDGSDSAEGISLAAERLREALGSAAFTLDNKDLSRPYNLMDQGLVSYPWPTIKYEAASKAVLPLVHYGDWTSGFQSGTLVYYEAYREKGGGYTYGFSGAGVPSTLKETNNVVGDGYAVVVRETETPSFSVTIASPANSAQTLTQQINQTESSVAGVDYYLTNGYKLFPLRALIVESGTSQTASISNTPIVNETGFYLAASVGSSRYFFNPHFANTVREAAEGAAPTAPSPDDDPIAIRTSRQLYNLSKYYQQYRECTRGCTFKQYRQMKYSTYEWENFYERKSADGMTDAEASRIKEQVPIGTGAPGSQESFVGNYDGGRYRIEDVGFAGSGDKNYLGMFGYVGKGSVLKDIVLCTDYSSAEGAVNYCVKREQAAQANTTVYMGVLAGYNAGTITNCAVAGYFLDGMDGTVHALANSTIHAGGLAGGNIGTIKNCSADCPKLRLSQYLATVTAGGFVGINKTSGSAEGTIKNCYALGAIELADARGGSTSIGGFAGSNKGSITSCYSAVPIIASGESAKTFGFAPAGGYVSRCTYLDGATYSYVKNMYSFGFDPNGRASAGTPVSFDELCVADTASNAVTAGNSHVHSETVSSSGRYPFAGKVRNKGEEYVHYGNWLDDAVLGTLGAFYWEHEVGGRNDGYHMTHIGTEEDTVVDNGAAGVPVPELVAGTSLCNAHDDEGVITEYGYGFYVQKGQEDSVAVELQNISCSAPAAANTAKKIIASSNYNTQASTVLREELSSSDRKYVFVAFTTSTADGAADYIRLSPTGSEPNGSLTLRYTNTAGKVASYSFEVSPFFANALSISKYTYDDVNPELDPLYGKAADGARTNYKLAPGTHGNSSDKVLDPAYKEKNYYEIRSVQQLQYINWNTETEDVGTLVPNDEAVYKAYPYLQYYNVASGSQSREAAEAAHARPARYWMQTHDICGDGEWDDPTAATAAALGSTISSQAATFSPIAGSGTSSDSGYKAKIYAWFGGHYDGQSYTIKNVSIHSKAFAVGLFGVTVGAEIKNIIMQGSNGNAVVERAAGSDDGAYSLGGLVGLAISYPEEIKAGSSVTFANTIYNCAISDYDIIDSSTSKQTNGEACVGGLIGVAKLDLNRCAAVTSITVQSTPQYRGNNIGNYIRVGGLVGGLRFSCSNSYSGGDITVSGPILEDTHENNKAATLPTKDIPEGTYAHKYSSTHIYLAGIAGSSFSSTIENFGDTRDTAMKINNCYTFMRFPTMEGTIRSISMIGSVADRYDIGFVKPVIKNCYYLDSSADIKTDLPEYIFSIPDNGGDAVLNKPLESILSMRPEDLNLKSNDSGSTYLELMLKGDLNYLMYYYEGFKKKGNDVLFHKTYDLDVEPRSYAEMSALDPDGKLPFAAELNSSTNAWDAVTTVDHKGGQIDGKYSYASNEALDGKNYPFPAVITQNDLTYGTVTNRVDVHVHYGNWPTDGSVWERGRDTIDIFKDMKEDGWAKKNFVLNVDTGKTNLDGLNPAQLKSFFSVDSTGKYAEVDSVTYDSATEKAIVTIKAKDVGATVVTFKKGSDEASFTLEVTAKWQITAEATGAAAFNPGTGKLKLENNPDAPAKLVLHAASSLDPGKDFTKSDGLRWGEPVSSNSSAVFPMLAAADPEAGGYPSLTLRRYQRGTITVTVPAVYRYGNVELEQQLVLTVVEPGVIGISNGNAGDYNEVQIGEGGPSHLASYPEEEEPRYALSEDHNFFLYVSSDEALLNGIGDITDISINGESCDNDVYDAVRRPYYVRIDGKEAGSGQFSYLGGIVSYNGDSAPTEDLKLEVTVKNGVGDPYVLRTTIPKKNVHRTKTITCRFLPGNHASAPAGSREVAVPFGGRFTFDDPTAEGVRGLYNFTVQNQYVFTCWLNGDGRYEAGQTITIAGTADTVEFTAQWVKRYLVKLDWGDGAAAQEYWVFNGDKGLLDESGSYSNKKKTLSDAIADKGFKLEGWYTSADSNGEKILDADGAVVAEPDEISGYVKNGAFAFEELSTNERTLHAKWLKRDIFYVLDNGPTSGKKEPSGNYVIANKKPSSDTSPGEVNILAQSEPDEALEAISIDGNRVAGQNLSFMPSQILCDGKFKDDADNALPYFLGNEIGLECVWKAEGLSGQDGSSMLNQKYQYYLADNDCKIKNGFYVLTAISDFTALKGWAENPSAALKRASFFLEPGDKLKANNNLAMRFTSYSVGNPSTTWSAIQVASGGDVYLYREVIEDMSAFSYTDILNGTVTVASSGSEGGSNPEPLSLFSLLFNKPDDEPSAGER